jgi:PilZ domain
VVAFKINRPSYPALNEAATAGVGKPARSPRRRVLLKGVFQSLTSSYPVAVRNLSCTGAAIVCDAALAKGARGVLAAQGLDRLCRVVWSRGRVHGLKFDEPLHVTQVLELHGITRDDVKAAEREEVKSWFDHQAW